MILLRFDCMKNEDAFNFSMRQYVDVVAHLDQRISDTKQVRDIE